MKIRFPLTCLFALAVLPYAGMYTLWNTSHLFLPDDAYYYLQIAKNLHDGWGSTFDQINPTNGYHPLWLLSISPLASPALSKDVFVSLVLLLQCGFIAGSWFLAYRVLYPQTDRKGLILSLLVATLLTWNYYISKTIINGLDSAMFLILSVLLLRMGSLWITEHRAMSYKRSISLGLLLSLTILARLDGIFYVPVILAAWCWYRSNRLKEEWRHFALVGFLPGMFLAGYMVLNQKLFGIWMPVSGYIKREWQPLGPSAPSLVAFVLFLGVLILLSRFALRSLRDRAHSAGCAALLMLTGFLALYEADLMVLRTTVIPDIWYLSQHVLWFFMVTVLLLERLLKTRRIVKYTAIPIICIIWGIGILATWNIRLQPSSYDRYIAAREAAQWMNTHLPEDAILAGWDVGLVGYYAERPVVNLDGLVNSYEYYNAMNRREGIEFLDRTGVDYIVQYYNWGFVNYSKPGFDMDEFRKRADRAVWSRDVRFASLREALRTGKRIIRKHPYQIRRYESAAR